VKEFVSAFFLAFFHWVPDQLSFVFDEQKVVRDDVIIFVRDDVIIFFRDDARK